MKTVILTLVDGLLDQVYTDDESIQFVIVDQDGTEDGVYAEEKEASPIYHCPEISLEIVNRLLQDQLERRT